MCQDTQGDKLRRIDTTYRSNTSPADSRTWGQILIASNQHESADKHIEKLLMGCSELVIAHHLLHPMQFCPTCVGW